MGGEIVKKTDSSLLPYTRRWLELSLHRDCVLWGNRVVIPTELRQEVLKLLHQNHPGMTVMKAVARSYIRWPGMDTNIEEIVRTCNLCQQTRNLPEKEKGNSWEPTDTAWERIHVDIAGPCNGGKYFLIVVDSFSKWLEVKRLKNITSEEVIIKLRGMFATFGLPMSVVSDCGSQFVSEEIKRWYEINGIRGIAVAPGHPSSNGQAERMVQITKKNLELLQEGDLDTRLARMLFKQHTTPTTSTGKSPAELMFQRKLRTALSALHPSSTNRAYQTKEPRRQFNVGDTVFAINLRDRGDKWLSGKVIEKKGFNVYIIQLTGGQMIVRHIDQIRRCDMAGFDTSSPQDAVGNDITGDKVMNEEMEQSTNTRCGRTVRIPNRFKD